MSFHVPLFRLLVISCTITTVQFLLRYTFAVLGGCVNIYTPVSPMTQVICVLYCEKGDCMSGQMLVRHFKVRW
jgi:hypothetical protein